MDETPVVGDVEAGEATTTAGVEESDDGTLPTVVLVVGMAGSGKTTLMQRLVADLHQRDQGRYVVNLDPAVTQTPYPVNVDICDSVQYRNVMSKFRLGPNGAIVTSLNLFATQFDQVVALMSKRKRPECRYILIDTPGQIEVFTWSASGNIITEMIASVFPTVVLFVVDTPRSSSPTTFMSNMLYACSIMYKTRLPFVVCFNKTDITPADFASEWMSDYEALQDALAADDKYISTLTRSMALVLDEFYRTLSHVAVSAVTGMGVDLLWDACETQRKVYYSDYMPELQARIAERRAAKSAESLQRLRKDLSAEEAQEEHHDGAAQGQ